MGRGRWTRRRVGGEERHTIEFGFKYMFSVRAGPKRDGVTPEVWWAASREGSLGEFATLDDAKKACEDEARRLIETPRADNAVDFDDTTIREQWKTYLADPKRMRSVKTTNRYK